MKRKAKSLVAAIAGILFSLPTGNTAASVITYELTVTKPLTSAGGSIGGALLPVIFNFTVDSSAPNICGCAGTTDALYEGMEVSLRVGSEVSDLHHGPTIHISDFSPQDDVPVASANTYDDGTRISDRSLFVVDFAIWGPELFSGTALPDHDAFVSSVRQGFIALTFRPLASDPEFPNDYVKFQTFVSPEDFSLRVGVVPEPAALSLLGLGLAGFAGVAAGRRRGRT